MLGEQSFQPYAINTFSHRGKNFEEITPFITSDPMKSDNILEEMVR